MEEIINAFGLDGRLIVIQIVNFGILLFALWYFLYDPILNIIQERQRKVAKGVEDAKQAEAKLERAEEEKNTIVKRAHEEAETVLARGKEHAKEKEEEIVSDAQQKSERIVGEAKQKAEVLKEEAQKESEQEVARMAILAAEKVLRERK